MRNRRLILGTALGIVAVATAVAVTAQGQERPVAEPKYYQSKVSPAPPGMFPGTTVRQGGQPDASTPPPAFGTGAKSPASPPPQFNYNPTLPAPIAATPAAKPTRITQPVVAGPDGVYQAAGTDPFPPPTIPGLQPPAMPGRPTTTGALPPPMIVLEPSSTPNPLPTIAPAPFQSPTTGPTKVPPSVFDLPGTTPAPTVRDAVIFPPTSPTPAPTTGATKPVLLEQPALPAASPAFALGTPLPSRQAPSVTVEFVAPESVSVGQSLTYELLVRNVGTSAVMNLRVEDELPARCALVGTDPAAETTGERLAWSIGTLEAGVEKRIKVTVKPSDEGDLRSRAVVTFAAVVDARVKVTRPKISVVVTGSETARVGDKVAFQIQLANTGTGTASRITLQARFSDGFTHPQGSVIEAELAGLPAGQTKTLSLEAIAAKSGPQTCILVASADGGAPETAKSSVVIVEPMLQVKQAGPGTVIVRSEPVYQIELTNPGSATTDPVQLWTTLPIGFEFLQATDGGNFVEANRAIGWKLPGLLAGQTKVVSLKVRSSAPAEGVIRTVATAISEAVPAVGVVAADHRMGAKGLEARTETAVKAEGIAALRFEVSDIDDPVEVGKEAVYEIRIVNQGTGPSANVQIVADLAEGTSAAGATGPTAGRVTGQQIVFEAIPLFGVKAEAVYRVRVRGDGPGEHRFRVRLACDHIKTPISKEENTRFYKP